MRTKTCRSCRHKMLPARRLPPCKPETVSERLNRRHLDASRLHRPGGIGLKFIRDETADSPRWYRNTVVRCQTEPDGLKLTGTRRGCGDRPIMNVPFLELIQQCLVADPQFLSRAFAVPVGLRKCPQDDFPLHLFRRLRGDFFECRLLVECHRF